MSIHFGRNVFLYVNFQSQTSPYSLPFLTITSYLYYFVSLPASLPVSIHYNLVFTMTASREILSKCHWDHVTLFKLLQWPSFSHTVKSSGFTIAIKRLYMFWLSNFLIMSPTTFLLLVALFQLFSFCFSCLLDITLTMPHQDLCICYASSLECFLPRYFLLYDDTCFFQTLPHLRPYLTTQFESYLSPFI